MSAVLTPADRDLAERFAGGGLDGLEEEALTSGPGYEQARAHAEEQQIADEYALSDWLGCIGNVRRPCAYFGPISTTELFISILLNKDASDAQLAAAARELRLRYVRDHERQIKEAAALSVLEQAREFGGAA